MKDELQKVIVVMKKKEQEALQDVDKFEGVPHLQGIAIGKSKAYSSCIQWLILLLDEANKNSNPSSQTQTQTE